MTTAGFVRITRDQLPSVYDALDIISHDTGAKSGWHWYEVPTPYVQSLPVWEEKLSRLGMWERQRFCIGEFEEQDAMMRDIVGEQLHAFLNEFCNSDWERGYVHLVQTEAK